MLVALKISVDINNVERSISNSAGFQCHFRIYEFSLQFYTVLRICFSICPLHLL